jgi:hypothetical protein
MNEPQRANILEEEEYANAYYHFYKTLVTLTEDAEKQCEEMDNFNVAWEIRDDASRGVFAVLNLPGGKLSKEQRKSLEQLLTDITAIPDVVVNVSNFRKKHISAMSDPCWVPIRMHAKELVFLLESETKRTKAILGVEGS